MLEQIHRGTPLTEVQRSELLLKMYEISSKDIVTPDELNELVRATSQVALDVGSPEELNGTQINLPDSDHRRIEISLDDPRDPTGLQITLLYGTAENLQGEYLQSEDFRPQFTPHNVDTGKIAWYQGIANQPLSGTDLAKLAKEVYGAYQEGLPNPNPGVARLA